MNELSLFDTDYEIRTFDKEYEVLVNRIQHIQVGVKTLMVILEYVIDIVESIKEIRGNKKKTLAIRFITQIVNSAELDEYDNQLCMAMIDNGVIGDTIDLVINAHNGKLNYNKTLKTGSKCCFFIILKAMSYNKNRNKVKPKN